MASGTPQAVAFLGCRSVAEVLRRVAGRQASQVRRRLRAGRQAACVPPGVTICSARVRVRSRAVLLPGRRRPEIQLRCNGRRVPARPAGFAGRLGHMLSQPIELMQLRRVTQCQTPH